MEGEERRKKKERKEGRKKVVSFFSYFLFILAIILYSPFSLRLFFAFIITTLVISFSSHLLPSSNYSSVPSSLCFYILFLLFLLFHFIYFIITVLPLLLLFLPFSLLFSSLLPPPPYHLLAFSTGVFVTSSLLMIHLDAVITHTCLTHKGGIEILVNIFYIFNFSCYIYN